LWHCYLLFFTNILVFDAYEFDNMTQAKQALAEARYYRLFENAQIVEDFL